MAPQLLLLTLFLTSGGLIVLLSIPLIRCKVPPNSLYGFRVRRTLENPDIWYPANVYAAWHMLGLGAAIMIAACLAYFVVGSDIAWFGSVVGIVTAIGLSTMLFRSFRYLRKLTDKQL